MPVAQVEITQDRIVDEALKDDVLVASGAGIVDASQAIGTTWRRNGVGADDLGIFLDGFCKEFIVLSLARCVVGQLEMSHAEQISMDKRKRGYTLENVPESIFLFRRSSRVGSQTKSSHIWQ